MKSPKYTHAPMNTLYPPQPAHHWPFARIQASAYAREGKEDMLKENVKSTNDVSGHRVLVQWVGRHSSPSK